MKKYNFIIVLLTCLIIGGLAACENDAEGVLYTGREGVSFPSAYYKLETSEADEGKISVPLFRGSNKGAKSVLVSLADKEQTGTFTLLNPKVEFRDGESVAYLLIGYNDIEEILPGVSYNLTLTVNEPNQVSVSGIQNIETTIQRKLTYNSIGEGWFESALFNSAWEVSVEKAEEAEVYRLSDCYVEGYHLVFSINKEGNIIFPKQEIGYDYPGYGIISFSLVKAVNEGRKISFEVDALLPGDLFLGSIVETVTLPEE